MWRHRHARKVCGVVLTSLSQPRCLVGVEPQPVWRHRHARKVCGVVLTSLSQPRCLVGVEPPACVEASSCTQGLCCRPDLAVATSLRRSRTHSPCVMRHRHARKVCGVVLTSLSQPRCLVGVEPQPVWRHRHARKVCVVVLTSLSQPRCLVGVEPTACVEASSCTQGFWCCPDLAVATSLPRRSRTHSPCGGIVMHARFVLSS